MGMYKILSNNYFKIYTYKTGQHLIIVVYLWYSLNLNSQLLLFKRVIISHSGGITGGEGPGGMDFPTPIDIFNIYISFLRIVNNIDFWI